MTVKNHLRLALNGMMADSCGIVRRQKKVDPSKLTHNEIREGEVIGKLNCIKLYRIRLGCSLMEAKTQCEQQFEQLGKKFYGY